MLVSFMSMLVHVLENVVAPRPRMAEAESYRKIADELGIFCKSAPHEGIRFLPGWKKQKADNCLTFA